jgi:predicted acetyltransferase
MKLNNIIEMTQTFGKTGEHIINAMNSIYDNRKSYDHIGDINQAQVLYKNNIYLIILNNEPIGFFQVFNKNDTALVSNMFIIQKHRKKGWMSMFLFFLKQNESYSKIQLGDRHSEDTIKAIKRISKRFNIYWEKNGKREPYDIKTIDKYYSLIKPTGWNIILENDGDFKDYPKFWNHNSILQDLRIQYDILLD